MLHFAKSCQSAICMLQHFRYLLIWFDTKSFKNKKIYPSVKQLHYCFFFNLCRKEYKQNKWIFFLTVHLYEFKFLNVRNFCYHSFISFKFNYDTDIHFHAKIDNWLFNVLSFTLKKKNWTIVYIIKTKMPMQQKSKIHICCRAVEKNLSRKYSTNKKDV